MVWTSEERTMSLKPGTVIIGQSGGPTAVINQTLIGVVQTCLQNPQTFTRVLGAVHGVNGILTGEFLDFAAEDPANLEVVAATPSSALKSVRRKASTDDCAKILARFKLLNVTSFFYIGGNDTAETTHIIDDMAQQAGYPLALLSLPQDHR
jgi:6-phosphofructokinase